MDASGQEQLNINHQELARGGEFIDRHKGLIHDLVVNNAISLHPELKGKRPERGWFYIEPSGEKAESVLIDVPKAIALMEPFKREKEPNFFGELSEDKFRDAGQAALRQSIKALVDRGVISKAVAATVGKLVRPLDVVITPMGSRFLYDSYNFPKESGYRSALELSQDYTNRTGRWYRSLLEKHGISLSDDQLLNLTLRENTAHEYGHGVDRAMAIIITQARVGAQDKKDLFMLVYQVQKELHQRVYDDIAPSSRLQKLLSDKTDSDLFSDERSSSSERIAQGFGDLGFRFALEDLGIDAEKVEEIMQAYSQWEEARLDESTKVIEEAKNRNIPFEFLGRAVNSLGIALVEKGRRDLDDLLGLGFTSRNLGYSLPLTGVQIKEYLAYGFGNEVSTQ